MNAPINPDLVRQLLALMGAEMPTTVSPPRETENKPAPQAQSTPTVLIAGIPESVHNRYVELVEKNGGDALVRRAPRKDPSRFRYAKQAVREYHTNNKLPGDWFTRPEPRNTYDEWIESLLKISFAPVRLDVQHAPVTQSTQREVAEDAKLNFLQRARARNAEIFASRETAQKQAEAKAEAEFLAWYDALPRDVEYDVYKIPTKDGGTRGKCPHCEGIRSLDSSIPCKKCARQAYEEAQDNSGYPDPAGVLDEYLLMTLEEDASREGTTPQAMLTEIKREYTGEKTVRRMDADTLAWMLDAGNITPGMVIEIV